MEFMVTKTSITDVWNGIRKGMRGYITGLNYEDSLGNKLYEVIVDLGEENRDYLLASYQIKILN